MFKYKRKIFLSDTDLSGSIYFTNALKWAEQGLEHYIYEMFGSLEAFFNQMGCFLPIVNVNCDYLHPLGAGDRIEIELHCSKVGTSFFTLKSLLRKDERPVAKVEITHVFLDQHTKQPSEITAQFSRFLEGLK